MSASSPDDATTAPPAGGPGEIYGKRRSSAPAGFFAAEAAGLRWLAEPAGSGGVPVASVLDSGPQHITLRRVPTAPATPTAAEDFGRRLAATHAAGASAFGVGPEGGPGVAFIGRQPLELGDYGSWGAFYAELRLLPFARAARDSGRLSPTGAALVELVCDRLRSGEFDTGRPAERIHGDLWAGNVIWSPGGAVLIDPAAHGGAGETDLAMLALFGLDLLDRVQAAYAEAADLPADWAERTGLHQLHPLLVHAVSHSAAYGRAAEDLAGRYA